MTRRLGGTGKGGLNGLATLSLGALMGCCLALAGCSDDNGGGSSTTTDGGSDTGVLGDGGSEASDGAADARADVAADVVMSDAPLDSAVVDAGPQCATPTFSVPSGTITAGTSVTFDASGLPATDFIYFTTDGSLPNHNSPAVNPGGSIVVNNSETLRALAYAAGVCTDSNYATVTYTVVAPDGGAPDAGPQCAAPTFSPAAGTVAAGTVVTLTDSTLPVDGYIFYTTDGSLPNHTTSPVLQSGGTITINQSGTIRALAYAAGECTDSVYATAQYTVPTAISDGGPEAEAAPPLPNCPTPTIAPAAGTIASGTNVVISAAGLPSTGYIFFTTDNTLPTDSSPIYNAGTVGFPLTTSSTVRAISSTLGATCIDSPVAVSTYTVTQPPPPDAGPDAATEAGPPPASPEKPTFSPTGTAATQANDFTVTLADTTTTATICYTLGATATPACTTTGGTAVCTGGTLTYSAPITVNSTVTTAGSVEIQAVACVPGAAPSGVASSVFTLQAATPTFNQAAGSYTYSSTLTASFQSNTTGATIYYTSNGNTPSCTTPATGQLTYAVPFALQTGTYQAVACKNGYVASAPSAAAAVTVNLTAPTITPAVGTFSTALAPQATNSPANPPTSWVCWSTSTNGVTISAPACGAGGTCSAGSASTSALAVADGNQIQAIACAPPGLSNSAVTTQGPYKLQLAPPYINPGNLSDGTTGANAAGAVLPSFTLTAPNPNTLAVAPSLETNAVAAGWLCYTLQSTPVTNPVCGPPAVHTVGTCVAPATKVDGSHPVPTDVSANETLAVISCPATDQGAGYEASTVATTAFTNTGAAAPVISVASGAENEPVTAVLTNWNTYSTTACYTTDGTAPTCPATGSTICTPTPLASAAIPSDVTIGYAGGTLYSAQPWVTISNLPVNGNGVPAATCTPTQFAATTAVIDGTGALSGTETKVTVSCSELTSSPTVTLDIGHGAAAGPAQVTEAAALTVTAPGTGYDNAANKPTVKLVGTSGATSTATCTVTPTSVTVNPVGGGLLTVTLPELVAAGCPVFSNGSATVTILPGTGAGSGAAASGGATITQTVTIPTASITPGLHYTAAPAVTLVPASGGGSCTTTVATLDTALGASAVGAVTAITASACSGYSVPTLDRKSVV